MFFARTRFRTALAVALVSATALTPLAAQPAASVIDLEELTIAEIHAAYAAGTYTAVQLTQAYLDRIARYEPTYNAFTYMNEDALAEAAAIDAARAAGMPL